MKRRTAADTAREGTQAALETLRRWTSVGKDDKTRVSAAPEHRHEALLDEKKIDVEGQNENVRKPAEGRELVDDLLPHWSKLLASSAIAYDFPTRAR